MINVARYFVFPMMIFPTLTHTEWRNWAGNQQCNPQLMESPRTKAELITAIKNAAGDNHKISILGARHSFSEIACGDDCCLTMKHFNNIVSIDPHSMQVRAEAGITLNEFNECIAQHGLALPNLPAMGDMTLAGALCTATHGTGNTGTLSSFIAELELITSDGTIHLLSEKHNPELFKAACVSIGALGVIYSVTIQCEPLFMLEYHGKTISFDQLMENYNEFLEQSDFFQCRWQLHNDLVCGDFWNRVPATHAIISATKKISYEALQWDPNPEPGMASEIAIPKDLFPQAIAIIRNLVNKWVPQGLIISELVCRFVKTDKNSYLSPTTYGDVVYLNIGTESEEKYYDFFRDFEQAMYLLQGKPHWGKVNFLNYESAFKLYGENLLKFIEIKHHIDPQNIFSNAYINRILGL